MARERFVDTFPTSMTTKKTIGLIIAALAAVGIVFLLVLFTAGTPRAIEPPVNKAPSGN
jgi:hypothetical protein